MVELTMYRDSAGLPTIGCGHLLTRSELTSGKLLGEDWRDGISMETCLEQLRRDTDEAQMAVNENVRVSLVQYQYDALVSFAFNVGNHAFRDSTLVRLLNAGDYLAVPAQLGRWIHSAGQVDRILVARRADEVRQWDNA